jgi:hypothetical protein
VSDLVVLIPTRGRPGAVQEIIESFLESCRENTFLTFVVDESDPLKEVYGKAVRECLYIGGVDANGWRIWERTKTIKAGVLLTPAVNMVDAMNKAAGYVLNPEINNPPKAIAFMGDDHRPRTPGWDTSYLEALGAKPGLVYGNDLYQGKKIPTQVAISAPVVRALGHMAPDVLTHLYVDDYWKALGTAADCLTYLPDVVVEHLHPVVGKAVWDEGYRRVNHPDMYERDGAAYGRYWQEHGSRDVERVKFAINRETEHGDQHF